MTDLIELRTNGMTYSTWTEARVSRELDKMAGDFEFRLVVDPSSGSAVAPAVKAGDACTVYVAGVLQLTGWIDEPDYELTTAAHSCVIRGRGRTGDLVDCSALNTPGTWSSRSALQLISALAAPFSIGVSAEVDVGATFPSFALQPGEKVYEVIHRIVQQRALLPIETETGDIRLIRPGQIAAGYSLQQGVNILSARHKHSHNERFSLYVLKGQAQGRDSKGDWLTGAPPTSGKWSPKASATDPGVTRYRPLEVINETQAFDTTLAQRARWEATVRAGKAYSEEVSVPGWRAPAGEVYAIDRLVPVTAPAIGVNADTLLVSGVHFRIDGASQLTQLNLTRKEAYSLLDLPDSKKGAGKKKGKKRKGPDPLLSLQ